MWIDRAMVISASVVALLLPATAGAQDKRVHVNVGGGPTIIAGTLGDGFSTGWGPAIGVTFDITERVGFQFEYAYRYFSLKSELDSLAGVYDANHSTHQLDFNMVATVTPPESRVRGYLMAGPGMYNRSVEVTEYQGSGIVCDPWLYLCGTYPITSVVGSRGGWDVGFNVGGGVGFKFSEAAEFFIETRYHYVWGPEPEPTATPFTTGTTVEKINGQYLPITFGVRF